MVSASCVAIMPVSLGNLEYASPAAPVTASQLGHGGRNLFFPGTFEEQSTSLRAGVSDVHSPFIFSPSRFSGAMPESLILSSRLPGSHFAEAHPTVMFVCSTVTMNQVLGNDKSSLATWLFLRLSVVLVW